MPASWKIELGWEPLDSGSPEERACFATVGIRAYRTSLTEGQDALANRLRKSPYLSAYHLAEWIAWNWWRLRWEPHSDKSDWALAHHLTTIGNGYIWPNILIFSDGERIALVAKQTPERAKTPYRYINDFAGLIQAREFESEVDDFVGQVLERLDAESVYETNLKKIWKSVIEERQTPDLARARKLEALLGSDPDESDPKILGGLISDSGQLSLGAVEELAADSMSFRHMPRAHELQKIAQTDGFEASLRDVVKLSVGAKVRRRDEVTAWRRGADAARALRDQENLGGGPISNKQLEQLAGVQNGALAMKRVGEIKMSYALDQSAQQSRVVFRSRWDTGRRFELARLLGDRLVGPKGGQLLPVTRSGTYRQKMQRSFAAEFLCPFDPLDEYLQGDYSEESQQEAAHHFEVSPLAVRTQLLNHGKLRPEHLEEELETMPEVAAG